MKAIILPVLFICMINFGCSSSSDDDGKISDKLNDIAANSETNVDSLFENSSNRVSDSKPSDTVISESKDTSTRETNNVYTVIVNTADVYDSEHLNSSQDILKKGAKVTFINERPVGDMVRNAYYVDYLDEDSNAKTGWIDPINLKE